MKVFHYVNFVIIIAFLIGICWLEESFVSKGLTRVQNAAFELEKQIDERDSLLSNDIAIAVDNLEYRWVRDENALCYMVNHKNMQELGMEISKLKGYIATDDLAAFKISLSQIHLFCRTYLHFMGASIHNVL